MLRGRVLLIVSIIMMLFVLPVHADSLSENKIKYDSQLETIKAEIKATEDRNKLIELVKEKNRIGAYVRAYDKAIDYSNKNTISEFQSLNLPPQKYISIYKDAAKKYAIDWTILAAVHKVETQFSTIKTMVSSAGAIGHMQFMPSTWKVYGVDGSGDGKADPYNVEDAIYSAANYLAATGAAGEQVTIALYSYNHSVYYGKQVMDLADKYKKVYATNTPIINVGKKYIGHSRYVFGGGRNQSDINKGIFDCSSFVHWAYSQNGIELGALSSVTTDTLSRLGHDISINNIEPGDLVFFDTYKKDGHVGIYINNGKFIGAQESTGVAIADMNNSYWNSHFNGHVVRIID